MTYAVPHVSRRVLALEMLLCFAPLALLFFVLIANVGQFQEPESFFYLSATALGPIGVVVAFKTIVLNRPVLSKPAAWALWTLALWTPVAYALYRLTEGLSIVGWWRELVLIGVLPAFAAVHLLFLARNNRGAKMR